MIYKFIWHTSRSPSRIRDSKVIAKRIIIENVDMIRNVKHCKTVEIKPQKCIIDGNIVKQFYRCISFEIHEYVRMHKDMFKYMKHALYVRMWYFAQMQHYIKLSSKLLDVRLIYAPVKDSFGRRLTKVKKFQIDSCGEITNAFSKMLCNVEILHVGHINSMRFGDAFFHPFRKVKHLSITGLNQITEKIFDVFEELHSLTLCHIVNIKHIPNRTINTLRCFSVRNMPRISLDICCRAPMLETLEISEPNTDIFRQLAQDKCLIITLHISGCRMNSRDYELFGNMDNLRELDVSECRWVTDAFGVYLANIKKLYINGCTKITDDFGKHFKNLNELQMQRCETLTDRFSAYLTTVEHLNMSSCSQQTITDAFSHGLRKVKTLIMRGCNQTTITATFISNLETLTSLYIKCSVKLYITEKIAFKLRNLESLEMCCDQYSELNFICGLRKLKYLKVIGTPHSSIILFVTKNKSRLEHMICEFI